MKLEGNIRELYPLLKIGEAIHIGKQTSFGCGLIRLQNVH
jgi:CRISPR/Cas system endoribonuclease Cas6 (RAMP superfamily)